MITERLQLVAATPELCQAERIGPLAVGSALGAQVPPSWPPPVFEPDDVERVRKQLEAAPTNATWTLYYVISKPPDAGGLPTLVGVAGFGGPPSPDGVVEIGYAVAVEHQHRGYATEAVRALVAHAFAESRVAVVVATTFPTLEPSIGVLQKTGFHHVASDPKTGLMRFERRRGPAEPPGSPLDGGHAPFSQTLKSD